MAQSIFRNDLFANKVAFVTGGGSGICMGITRALMQHGAKAAILGRKTARLAESATALEEAARIEPQVGAARQRKAHATGARRRPQTHPGAVEQRAQDLVAIGWRRARSVVRLGHVADAEHVNLRLDAGVVAPVGSVEL